MTRNDGELLALLETLLTTAPVGIGFWDRQLRCVRINDALAAINGIPVEQHRGRTLRELLPDVAPAVEPIFHRVLETGEPVLEREVSGETPAEPGHLRHWLTSCYPVRDQTGQLLGVGTIVVEITERKRAELVERERARLDGVRLAARTAQHRLNNHLAVTIGLTELLANDPRLPAGPRDLAREALGGAEEAASTVAQLQRIARLKEVDQGGPGPVLDLDRSSDAAQ